MPTLLERLLLSIIKDCACIALFSSKKCHSHLSSIFLISSIAPNATLSKPEYYVVREPKGDTWVSLTMTVFANVHPSELKVNDFSFATGRAVWTRCQLQVSTRSIFSFNFRLLFIKCSFFISKPILNLMDLYCH